MDTQIVHTEGGRSFNRHGEEVVDCRTGCGRKTTMLGTRLCDCCWEKSHKERLARLRGYEEEEQHA